MSPFQKFRLWFFPEVKEKEELVVLIKEETQRLSDHVDILNHEVRKTRKDRKEMSQLLDDTLSAVNKEYRR